MDPTQLRTLVIFVFPALFGGTLIAFSTLTCWMRRHYQRLENLEMRVSTLESGPRLTSSTPTVLPPVYQILPPSAPAADPLPPTHVPLSIPPIYPVVQTAQPSAPRYVAYI